jgi:hypothetical protein
MPASLFVPAAMEEQVCVHVGELIITDLKVQPKLSQLVVRVDFPGADFLQLETPYGHPVRDEGSIALIHINFSFKTGTGSAIIMDMNFIFSIPLAIKWHLL